MAEAKTKPTKQSVAQFINSLPDAGARADCATLAQLMQQATRAEPQMWGSSIVGFGIRQIQYAGGRTGDWPIVAFSPRKQNLTLYVAVGQQDPVLMEKLGKHTVGKGCLYVKRLSDVDLPTLKKVIKAAVKQK
jgi:uncharacterized protein DUF1801